MTKAVVLINLGGPESAEEVRPFLKRLFSDRDIFSFPGGQAGSRLFSSLISRLRAPIARKHYAHIGGASPIRKNTEAQAEALQAELGLEYRVMAVQRYSNPDIAQAIRDLKAEGVKKVLLLPLFPQYSTTTTLSVFNEWERLGGNRDFETVKISRFYENEDYLQSCADRISEAAVSFEERPCILFSAHGLPISRVKSGDPYPEEVEATVRGIMEKLGQGYAHGLCYQSKVGPVEWLGPSIQESLTALVAEGKTDVLVFPVSFVSEHLETLYELDIEHREFAENAGIRRYERAGTPGTAARFIQGLKTVITENDHE